jgi:ParB family transcriptional regulator, chromosome partitioning protein
MADKKRGLGRGLSDLLSPVDWLKKDDIQLFYSPLDQLVPNPFQPRQSVDDSRLDELVASIREKGVIQPILVARTSDPNQYQILAGERRWRASKLAGLSEVPVLIRDSTPAEALEIALIENIQRQDLNCIEEAVAYQRLHDDFNLTQEDIASRVGKDRSTVANLMRILQLPQDIQAHVLDGKITMGHARALLGVPDPERQRALCRLIISRRLSVRQTEQLAAADPAATGSKPPRNPELADIERRLSARLGSRVRVSRSGERGTISLSFQSTDQFQRLVELLIPDA